MKTPKFDIIYIAGPMTGLPLNNHPAFHEAESDLQGRLPHAEIINPARNFGKGATGLTHADYMRRCIPQVMLATHIYVLRGWEDSVGARWEVETAKMLGVTIVHQFKDSQKSYADRVIETVCEFYREKVTRILSTDRTAKVCLARHVCMYWLYESDEHMSYSSIAKFLNRIDHATIMHGYNKIADCIESDRQFQRDWELLEPILKAISRGRSG